MFDIFDNIQDIFHVIFVQCRNVFIDAINCAAGIDSRGHGSATAAMCMEKTAGAFNGSGNRFIFHLSFI